MNYLLDTNIIIIYSRDNQISKEVEKQYQLFSGNHDLYISIVTLGEIDAFIKKNKIGKNKQKKITKILESIYKINIEYKEVIAKYGDIDAFSQGKLKIEGHNFTARNMGKNDIWIASTASYYDLKLITTENDFGHLNNIFIDLEFINIEEIKKQMTILKYSPKNP